MAGRLPKSRLLAFRRSTQLATKPLDSL